MVAPPETTEGDPLGSPSSLPCVWCTTCSGLLHHPSEDEGGPMGVPLAAIRFCDRITGMRRRRQGETVRPGEPGFAAEHE
jgi:hypothetical protein